MCLINHIWTFVLRGQFLDRCVSPWQHLNLQCQVLLWSLLISPVTSWPPVVLLWFLPISVTNRILFFSVLSVIAIQVAITFWHSVFFLWFHWLPISPITCWLLTLYWFHQSFLDFLFSTERSFYLFLFHPSHFRGFPPPPPPPRSKRSRTHYRQCVTLYS